MSLKASNSIPNPHSDSVKKDIVKRADSIRKNALLLGDLTFPIDKKDDLHMQEILSDSSKITRNALKSCSSFTDDDTPKYDIQVAIKPLYDISRTDNGVVKVVLPPPHYADKLAARSYGKLLYDALIGYIEDNPDLRNLTDNRMAIIYKVYAPRPAKDVSRDADNIGLKYTSNAITNAFSVSDNIHSLALFFIGFIDDNPRIEAVFLKQNDLQKELETFL